MSTTPNGRELTAQEAFGSLTYFEIQDMKKSFGVSMSQLEELAVEAMYALIWVIERRTNAKYPANDVKAMPFDAVVKYFAEEDLDQTEDSEQVGKSESAAES